MRCVTGRDSAGDFTLQNCTVSYSYGSGAAVRISGASGEDRAITGCTVSNNGATGNGAHGFQIQNASPTFTGNTANDNGQYGFHVTGASSTPHIVNCTVTGNLVGIRCEAAANPLIGGAVENWNKIAGNTNFGVQNTSDSGTVDATYNDWGSVLGPYHPDTKPSGTGNPVSDYVDFSNWLEISDVKADLDNNGETDLADLVMGLKILARMPVTGFHPDYVGRGIDVDGDQEARMGEVLYLLQTVSELRP